MSDYTAQWWESPNGSGAAAPAESPWPDEWNPEPNQSFEAFNNRTQHADHTTVQAEEDEESAMALSHAFEAE